MNSPQSEIYNLQSETGNPPEGWESVGQIIILSQPSIITASIALFLKNLLKLWSFIDICFSATTLNDHDKNTEGGSRVTMIASYDQWAKNNNVLTTPPEWNPYTAVGK